MLTKCAFFTLITLSVSIKDLTPEYHRSKRAVCNMPKICRETKKMKKMQDKLENLMKSTESDAVEHLSNLDELMEKLNKSIVEVASNLTAQQEKLETGIALLNTNRSSAKLKEMETNLTNITISFNSKVNNIESKHLKMTGKYEWQQIEMQTIEERAFNLKTAAIQLPGIDDIDFMSETRDSVHKDNSTLSSVKGILQKLGRTEARITEADDAMTTVRKSTSSLDGKLADLEMSRPVTAHKIEDQRVKAEEQRQFLTQVGDKVGALEDTLRALEEQGTGWEFWIKVYDAAIEQMGQSFARQEAEMKTMNEKLNQ